MCIHKLELNFSDFCEYSCISEINFPKKKHIKILVKCSRFVSSINFENRLLSKPIRFQKAVPLICVISLPLHRWQNILCLTYVLFFLPWGRYQWNRSCQLFLKSGRTIRKATIMVSKNVSQEIFCWLLLAFP